jgi:disulfide bond formation protein DsbB
MMSTTLAGESDRAAGSRFGRSLPVLAGALAFALAAVTIATAWGFQLIGGYAPCALCLEQRLPYYAGLPLIAAGLLADRLGARLTVLRVALVLAAGVFAYGLALGVYQAGAEWAFWPGPTDCGGGVATTATAGNLLAQIQSTRLVSCTEASWRMFGLSFAGWNAVTSLAIVALTLGGAVIGLRRPGAAR